MQPSAISVQDVYERERTLLESCSLTTQTFFEIGISAVTARSVATRSVASA